jgi:hypothetical protein
MTIQISRSVVKMAQTFSEKFFLRQPNLNPIVLLGHDRSGTSWIGDVLASVSELVYCYEPLNPTSGFNGDWIGWRQYIARNESNNLYEQIFDPVFQGHLPRINSIKKLSWEAYQRSIKPYRILVKETGGVLAGEFFAGRYDANIVIIKRHPIAVALSNLRQGRENAEKWRKIILAQKHLKDTYLNCCWHILENNYESDLNKMLAVISSTYKILYEQCCRYNWLLVSYEDFCLNPQQEFSKLFQSLNLTFSASVRSNIVQMSSQEQPGAYSRYRISSNIVNCWRQQIDFKTLQALKNLYGQFEIPWYKSDLDWDVENTKLNQILDY